MGLVLAAAVSLSSRDLTAKGLTVSPSHVFATVARGGEFTQGIRLTPTTGESTRIRALVDSFAIDPEGKPLRGGGSGFSRALLSVTPASVVLVSGKSATLTIRGSVPPGASGTSWAVVVLEVEPVRTEGEEGRPVDVVTRVAVPVFLTVAGSEDARLALRAAPPALDAEGRVEVRAEIMNPSTTIVRASGVAIIENAAAEELDSIEVRDLVVLPGAVRVVRAVLRAPLGLSASSWRVLLRYGPAEGDALEVRGAVEPSAGSGERPRAPSESTGTALSG